MRLNEIDDLALARGRRNAKAVGYDAALAKQEPLRTLEPGPEGLQMRNVHDIIKDLTLRAMGNSTGDKIKASEADGRLMNIILELLGLTQKRYTEPYLQSPSDEHRAELYNVIIPRIKEIVAEIEAADGT